LGVLAAGVFTLLSINQGGVTGSRLSSSMKPVSGFFSAGVLRVDCFGIAPCTRATFTLARVLTTMSSFPKKAAGRIRKFLSKAGTVKIMPHRFGARLVSDSNDSGIFY
jgi:hypothetical protein